jgi:hypothetical protein
MQDTDGDGLFDGEEVTFYKTSPILDDTDGDQILDGEEVILANRNARIADLAQPTIEIESISLELDARFDTTKEATIIDSKEDTFSTTLTQSNSKSHAKTNEEDNRVVASVTASHAFTIGADTLFVPKAKINVSVTGRVEHGWSSSWSSESSKATQNEYNKSLATSQEVSQGTTISRHVEEARISTLVYLAAEGDVAFTLSELQITALVADIRNPDKYLPVATLVPDSPTGKSDISFHLGPLADKIGPLIFTSKDIFPAQVERLMKDPSGVIFKISNYIITDEEERKFAFSSQDVVDRTSFISLDYGGAAQEGDGLGEGSEFYRVATSFGRTIASVVASVVAERNAILETPLSSDQLDEIYTHWYAAYGLKLGDDDDSLISYDLSGENLGVVFHDVMQDVLGLSRYEESKDASDSSEQFASYATTFNDKGVERITRIRQYKNAGRKQWSLLTPTGLITDAQLSFGEGDIIVDDQVLLPGSGISLAFIEDQDKDKIPARLEYLHGCSDDEEDSDDDGLSDILEVFGAVKNPDGSYEFPGDKWKVDVSTVGQYEGFSSCSSKDTDADGIPDFFEYHGLDEISQDESTGEYVFTAHTPEPDPDNPGEFLPTPRTDAKSQDTDGDGITDFDEIYGYFVQLEFPRVTTGKDPSECTDEVDDTTIDGTTLDKVRCTTDPLNPDSDGDALPDGAEFAFFADPTVDDAGDVSDADGDGLLGRVETDGWPVVFTYAAGPVDLYSADGTVSETEFVIDDPFIFTCGSETKGCFSPWVFGSYFGIANYDGVLPTSNPVVQDTDNDGLRDDIENDISLADTGFSGSTHPREVDTDQDGRSDFEELKGFPYKKSDFDASKPYQGTEEAPVLTNPLHYDTDGDGRSDGEEVNESWDVIVEGVLGSKTVFSNPNEPDVDDDGLNDSEEYNKTDPNDPNTDGTADVFLLSDGNEIDLGLEPLNPNDMCVQITFTSFKVLHDFVNIDQGDIKGDVHVRRYSNGTVGSDYLSEHIEGYNFIDDGVEEFVTGSQYTTYALMSDVQSIQVATTDFEFRPVAGSWWQIWNGSLVVKNSDFSLVEKEIKYSYEKSLNGVGGSFTPYFNFKVMTGADVDANPDETFCQGL